jgi:hypothetical protein
MSRAHEVRASSRYWILPWCVIIVAVHVQGLRWLVQIAEGTRHGLGLSVEFSLFCVLLGGVCMGYAALTWTRALFLANVRLAMGAVILCLLLGSALHWSEGHGMLALWPLVGGAARCVRGSAGSEKRPE